MDLQTRSPTRSPRPHRGRPTRPRRGVVAPVALACLAVAVLGLAACSGDGDGAAPAPAPPPAPDLRPAAGAVDEASPSVISVPDGYVAPDTRNVYLTPVTAKPTGPGDHSEPVLPMQIPDGKAVLEGVVLGPDGPVAGATVRLERFVGEDFGRFNVPTDEDGKWRVDLLAGGRYRVRAFAKPSLAMVESRSVFLNEDGKASFDLTLEKHEQNTISGALVVTDLQVGQRAFFKALVTHEEVDDDGIVRGTPVPVFPVGITGLDGVRVIGPSSDTTDGDGIATFVVMCTAPGDHSVVVGNDELALAVGLPPCADGAVPEENEPPEVPEFPVGQTFTTPRDTPLPPGTYLAVAGGPCGTSFEEWADNQWVRNTSLDKGLVFVNPVRRLAATPDTKPCTFRRTA